MKLSRHGNTQQAIALTLGDARLNFEQVRDQLNKLTEINLDGFVRLATFYESVKI